MKITYNLTVQRDQLFIDLLDFLLYVMNIYRKFDFLNGLNLHGFKFLL